MARLRDWAIAGLAAVVVCAPHFIVGGRHVLSYFWSNVFGEKSKVWNLEGSIGDRIGLFLPGSYGQLLLGDVRWAFIAVLLVAAIVALFRRSRLELSLFAGWAFTLILLYTFVVANPMKIREFGLPFQITFLFAAVEALLYLMRCQQRSSWQVPWSGLTTYAIAAVAIVTFSWPFPRTINEPGKALLNTERAEFAESVFDSIRDRTQIAARPMTVLTVGAPGDLGRALFNVWAARACIAVQSYNFWDL